MFCSRIRCSRPVHHDIAVCCRLAIRAAYILTMTNYHTCRAPPSQRRGLRYDPEEEGAKGSGMCLGVRQQLRYWRREAVMEKDGAAAMTTRLDTIISPSTNAPACTWFQVDPILPV